MARNRALTVVRRAARLRALTTASRTVAFGAEGTVALRIGRQRRGDVLGPRRQARDARAIHPLDVLARHVHQFGEQAFFQPRWFQAQRKELIIMHGELVLARFFARIG